MTFFARFYLLLAIVAVLAIWCLAALVFHPAEGWPRGLWILASVLVFVLICFVGNRAQRL